MRVVLDAFAWIEYLEGAEFAEQVEAIIQKNDCYISSVTVAECISKVQRSNGDVPTLLQSIFSWSKIIAADTDISIEAGRFHAEQRKKHKQFGMADAYVYCTAKKLNAKILTNDHHFKHFKETIMLQDL